MRRRASKVAQIEILETRDLMSDVSQVLAGGDGFIRLPMPSVTPPTIVGPGSVQPGPIYLVVLPSSSANTSYPALFTANTVEKPINVEFWPVILKASLTLDYNSVFQNIS